MVGFNLICELTVCSVVVMSVLAQLLSFDPNQMRKVADSENLG